MKKIKIIIYMVLLIAFDQITKILAKLKLEGNAGISIIKNVLKLEYVENRGAAFGIMQNKVWIFIIITIIVVIILILIYLKIPQNKKYLPLKIILVFLTSGAIGNLIDRVLRKYVVDFIYFELIDFPVFNVADCYVTISAISLAIVIMFIYKEDDLKFLKFKEE